MPADPKPISLDAYRARRKALLARIVDRARPVQPTYLGAEAGKVLLAFSNGTEIDLSPAQARLWAERVADMADTAEALAREGGPDAG